MVEHLTSDGYSAVEIAEVLKISERTIERDRRAIRESHALVADPALVPQMVGHLVGQAELAVGRLRRIARDRDTPAAVKVEAERSCWGISRDLVASLQRLGYLPTAPQEFRGEIWTGAEVALEAPGLDELEAELARVESIVSSDTARDGSRLGALAEVRDTVARLSIRARLRQITQIQGKDTSNGDAADNLDLQPCQLPQPPELPRPER